MVGVPVGWMGSIWHCWHLGDAHFPVISQLDRFRRCVATQYVAPGDGQLMSGRACGRARYCLSLLPPVCVFSLLALYFGGKGSLSAQLQASSLHYSCLTFGSPS